MRPLMGAHMIMLSRRDMVRSSGSLLGLLLARKMAVGSHSSGGLTVNLVHEFAAATARAISPDGSRLCLEEWKVSGYPLRVAEFGTWRMTYAGRFECRALAVDFFADGESLFLQFPPGKGGAAARQTAVEVGRIVGDVGEDRDQRRGG